MHDDMSRLIGCFFTWNYVIFVILPLLQLFTLASDFVCVKRSFSSNFYQDLWTIFQPATSLSTTRTSTRSLTARTTMRSLTMVLTTTCCTTTTLTWDEHYTASDIQTDLGSSTYTVTYTTIRNKPLRRIFNLQNFNCPVLCPSVLVWAIVLPVSFLSADSASSDSLLFLDTKTLTIVVVVERLILIPFSGRSGSEDFCTVGEFFFVNFFICY